MVEQPAAASERPSWPLALAPAWVFRLAKAGPGVLGLSASQGARGHRARAVVHYAWDGEQGSQTWAPHGQS